MPQQIDVPGFGVVEFPDGMSDDAIASAIKQNLAPGQMSANNVVRAAAEGVPVIGGALNKLNAATNATLAPAVEPFLSPSSDDISRDGANWTERFKRSLEMQNRQSHQFEQQNPITSKTANVVGGVASMLPLMRAAPAAFGIGSGSLMGRSAASAVTGGVLGGADSAVRSEGDLEQTISGAQSGTAFGAAAPMIGQIAGKAVGGLVERFKPTPRPTVQELKAASNAAYDAAENAGARYSAQSTDQMINDTLDTLRKSGIDRDLHPKTLAAARRLNAAPTEPTIRELDTLRQIANDAAGSIDAGERRLGKILVNGIDDFVNRAGPADVVGGDPAVTSKAINEARSLWSASRKAETVDKVLEKAERQAASAHSGGNYDNAVRRGFKNLLNNDKKIRGFTADERAGMEQIVRGGSGQNIARAGGKILGGGGGLGAMLTSVAGGHVAPPLAAAPAVGYALKRGSDAATAANVANLQTIIANRGTIPANPLRQTLQDGATMGAIGLLNQRDTQGLLSNQAHRASSLLLGRQ